MYKVALLALLSALSCASYASPMEGGRVMLMAKRNMMVGGKPTARDYVQDGLIAMWDGIENAGWGQSTEKSDVWIDLIGGVELFNSRNPKRTKQGYYFDTSLFILKGNIYQLNNNYSVEVVFQKDTYNQYESITGLGWDGGVGVYIYDNIINRDYRGTAISGCVINDKSRVSVSLSNLGSFINSIPKPNNTKDTTWGSGTGNNTIGAYLEGGVYGFKGEICCVRYYDRTLTIGDVEHNFAIDKARFGI